MKFTLPCFSDNCISGGWRQRFFSEGGDQSKGSGNQYILQIGDELL
jgi:hypothetical protein